MGIGEPRKTWTLDWTTPLMSSTPTPKQYWKKDLNYAVYIINQMITGLKTMTFNSGENGFNISMPIQLPWNTPTGIRKNGHLNPNED